MIDVKNCIKKYQQNATEEGDNNNINQWCCNVIVYKLDFEGIVYCLASQLECVCVCETMERKGKKKKNDDDEYFNVHGRNTVM